MKLVDMENEQIAAKPSVIQFFSLPNFLDVIVKTEIDGRQQLFNTTLTQAGNTQRGTDVVVEDQNESESNSSQSILDDNLSLEDTWERAARISLFDESHFEGAPEWQDQRKARIRTFLFSPRHNYIVTAGVIVSIPMIVWMEYMTQFNYTNSRYITWVFIVILINMGFLADLILHFVAFDARWILKQKTQLYLEIVCQILSLTSIVLFCIPSFKHEIQAIKIVFSIFFMRSLIVIAFLQELEAFYVIYQTVQRFTLPFMTICLTMYTIYFTYATLGMLLWSGVITTISVKELSSLPTLYYLMNFNDFGSSLVTLFHIMVINNWFVTCDMYCSVVGNNWPRLYFVSFLTISVWIMLNLVISFVIDIYDQVKQMTEEEFQRRSYVLQLRQKFQRISETPNTLTTAQELNVIPEEEDEDVNSQQKQVSKDQIQLLQDLKDEIDHEEAMQHEEDLGLILEVMESAGDQTDARKSGRLLTIVGKKSDETESAYRVRITTMLQMVYHTVKQGQKDRQNKTPTNIIQSYL